jgi:hypothetical protein
MDGWSLSRGFAARYPCHPTDEDLSVGTPALGYFRVLPTGEFKTQGWTCFPRSQKRAWATLPPCIDLGIYGAAKAAPFQSAYLCRSSA